MERRTSSWVKCPCLLSRCFIKKSDLRKIPPNGINISICFVFYWWYLKVLSDSFPAWTKKAHTHHPPQKKPTRGLTGWKPSWYTWKWPQAFSSLDLTETWIHEAFTLFQHLLNCTNVYSGVCPIEINYAYTQVGVRGIAILICVGEKACNTQTILYCYWENLPQLTQSLRIGLLLGM